jgi:hypothetical protein
MQQLMRHLSIVAGVAVVLSSGAASAAGTTEIRTAIKERYRPSRIELQSGDNLGRVARPGTVLTLPADSAAANRLLTKLRLKPTSNSRTPESSG